MSARVLRGLELPWANKEGNIYLYMKTNTSIELPDDLFIAAKRHAAGTRTSLRALVERGLRAELRHAPARPRRRGRIRWITVDGGLPPGLDPADRAAMLDRLARRT
ncbi:MAG: hypothetical protein ACHQO8_06630 [Vicinamibacterales bacterium]